MKYAKINKYIFTFENDILVDIEDFTNNNHLKEIINFKIGNKYKFDKYFTTYEQAFFDKFLENHEYLFFENGFTGLVKTFEKNILRSEFFQINGRKEGIEKIYNDNNKVVCEYNYVNNQIIEKKIFKNNALFENVKLTDIYKFVEIYYPNGEINEKYKLIINSNQKDGEYIKYYSNKKLANKCNYINGLKEGLYEEYYQNSNINIECMYKTSDQNDIGSFELYKALSPKSMLTATAFLYSENYIPPLTPEADKIFGKSDEGYDVYDIEVKDNHNFVLKLAGFHSGRVLGESFQYCLSPHGQFPFP